MGKNEGALWTDNQIFDVINMTLKEARLTEVDQLGYKKPDGGKELQEKWIESR